jgi:hypothetical protein
MPAANRWYGAALPAWKDGRMGSTEERSEAPSLTTLFTSLAEQSADSIVVVSAVMSWQGWLSPSLGAPLARAE